MRILMYSDVFGGPTTTFIYNDLLSLAKTHKVKYLCRLVGNSSMKYEDIETAEYYENRILKKLKWILEKNGWHLGFFNKRFSEKVNVVVSQFKPDIIQCNFGYEALRLTDNLKGANKKIPLVINFLGYDASFHLKRPSYVRKLKELSNHQNVFATCNTNYLKNNLESKGIFFRETRVIYTGVQIDFFDRKGYYPEKKNEYTYLQIATLSERKGQEITLLAFKQLLESYSGDKKLKLIIAGGKEDQYGEKIRNMPAELGIQDSVEFRDWINPEEAKELMLNANCFVHHSRTVMGRTEGIPTAISEAMAMELPVISTVHAGIPELVEDGINGFLVRENDVENYANRMQEIQSWNFMKINREKVNQKFNIQQRLEFFHSYYKYILYKAV